MHATARAPFRPPAPASAQRRRRGPSEGEEAPGAPAPPRVEARRAGNSIVAARRGNAETAEAAFNAGREEARDTGMWLLELLCARDLVQFVLEGQGRAAEGEVMIEAAAARMGKPVSDFEELLVKRREW